MPEKLEPPSVRVWIGGALIGAALLAAAIAGCLLFSHGKIKRERLLQLEYVPVTATSGGALQAMLIARLTTNTEIAEYGVSAFESCLQN